MIRLYASDPRYHAINEAQLSLCAAINASCHYDAWQAVKQADEPVWYAIHLPMIQETFEREQMLVAEAGRDG